MVNRSEGSSWQMWGVWPIEVRVCGRAEHGPVEWFGAGLAQDPIDEHARLGVSVGPVPWKDQTWANRTCLCPLLKASGVSTIVFHVSAAGAGAVLTPDILAVSTKKSTLSQHYTLKIFDLHKSIKGRIAFFQRKLCKLRWRWRASVDFEEERRKLSDT